MSGAEAAAMKANRSCRSNARLSAEIHRNIFKLVPDWRARLHAMKLHLDIRKGIVRERVNAEHMKQRIALYLRKAQLKR